MALKVSSTNMHIFFTIFQLVVEDSSCCDFKKVFGYLFETVRGLLIYAKEGKYDQVFMEEGLI